MNAPAACYHFTILIGSFLYQRAKPPQGTVLFINLLGKGLTPRTWVGDRLHLMGFCNDLNQEPMSRSIQLPHCNKPMHGIFTDPSIFRMPFLFRRKHSSGWRNSIKLVSFNWSWHSHGSHSHGKVDLKINQSMKTPWQECEEIARCKCLNLLLLIKQENSYC